ncbi:MAG: hypothetical protein LAO78_26430 [Acidobacteriia bacterium]|nr:hypothetical protein [Terriglobia bacterium]
MNVIVFCLIYGIGTRCLLVGLQSSLHAGVGHFGSEWISSPRTMVALGQSAADAYASALQEPDAVNKSILLERFLVQHPDSALVPDAMEQTLVAYRSLNREQLSEAERRRPSPINELNLPSLVVAVFLDRRMVAAMPPADPQWKAACQRADVAIRSLSQWPKPTGISADQYLRLRNKAEGIFYGMAGFCAFQTGKHMEARSHLLQSLKVDPNNIANMGYLAMADLETDPIDVTGFWYAAKEETLVRIQYGVDAAGDAYPYGEYKYIQYHGSRAGWGELVAQAATQTAPPPGFTVTRGGEHKDTPK